VSKYDPLTVLKETKARVDHSCSCCGSLIPKGDVYYRECVADRFLHSLHAKSFCADCFRKHGEALLARGNEEYLDEFVFWFNNRHNEDIFSLVLLSWVV